MTSDEIDSELVKLARVLRVEPGRIGYLDTVAVDTLRATRAAMTEEMVGRNAAGLARIAATAKVLPASVVAKITETTGSSLLTARLATVMDAPRAADIARRLSPGYLSRVAAHLDSAQVGAIVRRLPRKIVEAACDELVARRDWITLAAVVSQVADGDSARVLRRLDAAAVEAALRMTDAHLRPGLDEALARAR